ncbi:hypothetical protein [Beijerinckia sp. L45]|uniref:hypothetical protein n=1 Tax=Beijerinckia sp. L45 TaxID=1641855 RepID=UPI00131AC439|nr:hypothetical protein [Beijerinckia sp. L45]
MSNVIEFPRPKVNLPIRTREEFWAYKRDGAKISSDYARRFEMRVAEVLKDGSPAQTDGSRS